LQSNTFSGVFVGQKVITLQRVPSTNDYLKEELSKSAPFMEGTVILAVDQYAGRGQSGKVWQSQHGKNLTLSLLLMPAFLNPSQQFDLNVAISLALREVLAQILKQPVLIKWPNDLYVKNKKIGGMLIENILQGSHWKYSVIGIGLNVNQAAFPEAVPNACSIKQLLHQDYNIQDLLSDLCKAIEGQYLQLKAGNQAKQKDLYCQHIFGMNECRKFKIDGICVEGEIIGVNRYGRLILDFNGHITDFGFQEIEFLIS